VSEDSTPGVPVGPLRSFVVTGAGRGIGRSIVEAIIAAGDGAVAFDRDAESLYWAADHPAYDRLRAVVGDAASQGDTERAADIAESLGRLSGWVNNAAVFDDEFDETSADAMLATIETNLRFAVVGTTVAVARLRSADDAGISGGSIVNISSHQAARPVPGALGYATAKAAIEGLTRSTAVEYGASGIRANALSLGTIRTERLERHLDSLAPLARRRWLADLERLHPVGRIGRPEDVAAAAVFLLSDAAGFVSGATIPIDGGRAVLGHDPEAR